MNLETSRKSILRGYKVHVGKEDEYEVDMFCLWLLL